MYARQKRLEDTCGLDASGCSTKVVVSKSGLFWANFGPKRAKKFSKKNFLYSYRNIYYLIASYKKSEKINSLKSAKWQKAIFQGILGPFWPKIGQKSFQNFFCFHISTSIISYFHAKNQKFLTIQ